jgi:hypothetical protein
MLRFSERYAEVESVMCRGLVSDMQRFSLEASLAVSVSGLSLEA